MYTQDLEPPRPSGQGARVVAAPELEGLVERAVEARLKAALASVGATTPASAPTTLVERSGVAPLLPSDWGKGEEVGSTGRSARLDFFLGLMRRKGSHDLHLHAGHKPALRLDDKLVELPFRPLTPEDWARLVRPATPPAAWLAFSQHHDADFLYEAGELGRMRVNLFQGRQGPAAVIQAIPETARSLGDLGLPPQVERLASLQEGLCLLLGPSGSGVSTTAAALLEHINQTSARHIITLEDPIEYVFEAHKSLIQQREIGVHARSHAAALRAALRERPDVVFLGEISDTEVWSQALDAAAMGTLVLAVLPSRSLGEALERLETFIPAEERDVARVGLADSLSAVLCQRLLPRASGGKVPAVGLYLPDPALRKALRGGELGALGGMLANAPAPSLPLDQHLAELHAAGAVTREAALDAALDPSDLDKRLA
jgi:twitching motility protein PilT